MESCEIKKDSSNASKRLQAHHDMAGFINFNAEARPDLNMENFRFSALKQPATPNVVDQDLLKFEMTYAEEVIKHGVADFYIRDGATLAMICGKRLANGEFELKEVVLLDPVVPQVVNFNEPLGG